MKMSLQIGALFFLLTFIAACHGQKKSNLPKAPAEETKATTNNVLDFDSYFVEGIGNQGNNAPSVITRNILQDNKGNFWFASWNGIIGYDGESFTNYTDKANLRRFRAFSLLQDKSDKIWFGTLGAGVYRYDPANLSNGQLGFTNITTSDGLVNNSILCITEDSKGNIWLGTRGGLSIYDGKSFRNFTGVDGLCEKDINSIVEDKKGKFWMATRGEACVYDGQTFNKIKNSEGTPFINVRTLIEDKNGNIWLGGQCGLWTYDGNAFTNFTTDFIGNLYEDRAGNIWFSRGDPNDIYNMNLHRLDASTLAAGGRESTEIVKGEGQVFGIIEDDQGNIWFGLERGVGRYDGTSFEYFDK